jgi:hypothetical protein
MNVFSHNNENSVRALQIFYEFYTRKINHT